MTKTDDDKPDKKAAKPVRVARNAAEAEELGASEIRITWEGHTLVLPPSFDDWPLDATIIWEEIVADAVKGIPADSRRTAEMCEALLGLAQWAPLRRGMTRRQFVEVGEAIFRAYGQVEQGE